MPALGPFGPFYVQKIKYAATIDEKKRSISNLNFMEVRPIEPEFEIPVASILNSDGARRSDL